MGTHKLTRNSPAKKIISLLRRGQGKETKRSFPSLHITVTVKHVVMVDFELSQLRPYVARYGMTVRHRIDEKGIDERVTYEPGKLALWVFDLICRVAT